MNKAMTILYKVHGNLYVNLTNRCPCSCTFCLRQEADTVSEVDRRSLWLEHEPSFDEIVADFANYDMKEFGELVFCGYGEPTERLDVLLAVARYAKDTFGIKVRVNTNGMADLIWNRDTTPDFASLVDTVSISLNNPDPVRYQEIVRCRYGAGSFDAMLTFAKNVHRHVPDVVLTTVETVLTRDEEAQCARICEELGVTYRIRPWV
ncbi:MAG: TatD family nuclease-associated radical SAM protein [Mailhella sp.]|nr:TatD family nuclease-associated radical SAM protein [Mailhella sp.]